MGIVIEIRHYVTRAGKDIFDDWLTELADPRAPAKIKTLATANLYAKVVRAADG